MKPGIFLLLLAATSTTSHAATKEVQIFEGDGFGDWKVEGSAFGLAPIAGKIDGIKAELTGFSGEYLACSAHGGDHATGSLQSPGFKLTEDFLAFLIAGGKHPGKAAVQLLIDGKVVMEATGNDSAKCRPVVWDVKSLKGKTASIRILDAETGRWGIIAADHFILTDSAKPTFPKTTRGGAAPVGDLVSTPAIPGLTTSVGTKITVLADFAKQGVTSPTALALGEGGEIYVTETLRFRHGVADNRSHLYWYLDDISSRTTADRRKLHEKWQHKETITSLKFLTEKEDRVRVLSEPDPKTGVLTKSSIFAGKFNDLLDGPAAGVFAYEGTVFLACIPKIYALRDKNGDGEAEVRDVVQDEFGIHISFSGHDLNGFALGPDGRIYGTLGDRGMNSTTREGKKFELPDEGCVFRFEPDGSDFEVIHTGLRNPKEIAFDEFGNAVSVDNNCDQGDKARVVYIVEGADSGWHMGHQGLLVHHRQMGMEEKPPASWMAERMWETENAEQPAFIIPPVAYLSSGPSGLTYHPGAGFLESEAGRFLICDYKGGAASSGIWSFKVEPSGAGMKMSDSRKLNWGAAVTDVEYTWDGKLVVSDFIGGWASHDAGRVYSVEAEQPWMAEEAAQAAQWIKEGFEKRGGEELLNMLRHPDMRVRLRAQLALTRKPDGLALLTKAATQTTDSKARLHGVWGLGVIARRGSAVLPGTQAAAPNPALRDKARAALLPLLADADAEVRAQSIRVLGDSGLASSGIAFEKLLADASPRVQLFAAIAAGKMKATASTPALLGMIEKTDDRHLRHAGSYGLSLMESPAALAALKSHSSPRVRMAAVIALRRLKAPEIAAFLTDADPAVVNEAVRSINDNDISAARPQVAALLDQPARGDRSVMIWRRLLHSAFRTGDEINSKRVLKVALDPKSPQPARAEAFRLLAEWSKPHPVDQSTGRMAPIPERSPELIHKVLTQSISPLMQTEGKFLEAALALVLKNKLDLASVPDATLQTLVINEKIPGAARAEALELYAARKPAGLDALLAKLATGKDDDLAIGALQRLIESTPSAALEPLTKAVSSGSAHRKQAAWKLAAGLKDTAIASLFTSQLAELAKSQGRSPAALELLEAAEKRSEPEIKAALQSFKSAQGTSTDPLAAWLPSLEGGDAEKGAQIFESHPAGQCMRCHAGGHGGGDAGPDLSGIGLRGDARHFLESMVVPGAKVAMGYGISSVTLKGGKSVAGIVIADTPGHVDLDSSGKVLRVAREHIDTMTPPVSSMPPMAFMLSATELRDLVAWMGTQKSSKQKAKQRPAPELVTP